MVNSDDDSDADEEEKMEPEEEMALFDAEQNPVDPVDENEQIYMQALAEMESDEDEKDDDD